MSTGAGKGDQLRPVNGERYRSNFDRIFRGNADRRSKYPEHWGEPPQIQTADIRRLPGGYGLGSSTLAGWIQRNLDNDNQQTNNDQ